MLGAAPPSQTQGSGPEQLSQISPAMAIIKPFPPARIPRLAMTRRPVPSQLRRSPQRWPWLPGLGLALVSFGGAVLLQRPQLDQLRGSAQGLSDAELAQQQTRTQRDLALLKQLPDLGFRNLVANWAFLQFLQYFGDDEARDRTGYALSPDFFEVVLGRDPYFLDGYLFLSSSSSLFAGQPERSVEIIEANLPKLTPKLPDRAYYIWRFKAIDELLFLGDSNAAKQSFTKAAEWAATYDDAEGQSISQTSARTAEFLASNPDSKAAQISAWSMVLSNALDDSTRETAIARMQALGASIEVTPDGQFRLLLPPEPPALKPQP